MDAARDQALVRGLLEAYRHGLFPMADPLSRMIRWYDPDPRAIIPLEPGAFRVPRSLRQRVRSGRFQITSDTAFERVIRACARPEKPEECWIDASIIEAYCTLHRHGHAHSIEAWLAGPEGRLRLVGGLYGVALGGLFAGESMFSRPDLGGTDASKVCLVHLVGHLRRRGYLLLDTQFSNPHMARFGCREIPRLDYHRLLRAAVQASCSWHPFEPLGSAEAPVPAA
ncbi:MAG: leucyl/phenylalanyl-tRNA--protein transferase [Phycisphaerales bacterium]